MLLGFQRRKRRNSNGIVPKHPLGRRAHCAVISCAARSRVSCQASCAQEYPQKRDERLKASADITNTKKVRRLAAVCSSFASTAFQCFLPDRHFSLGNTMENSGKQNPKMGFKSPPSTLVRVHTTSKWLTSSDLRYKLLLRY